MLGGDSAFHTFDGTYYSLPPPISAECGERILSKSIPQIDRSQYTITYKAEPCENDHESSCIISLTLQTKNRTYNLGKNLTVSFLAIITINIKLYKKLTKCFCKL